MNNTHTFWLIKMGLRETACILNGRSKVDIVYYSISFGQHVRVAWDDDFKGAMWYTQLFLG